MMMKKMTLIWEGSRLAGLLSLFPPEKVRVCVCGSAVRVGQKGKSACVCGACKVRVLGTFLQREREREIIITTHNTPPHTTRQCRWKGWRRSWVVLPSSLPSFLSYHDLVQGNHACRVRGYRERAHRDNIAGKGSGDQSSFLQQGSTDERES